MSIRARGSAIRAHWSAPISCAVRTAEWYNRQPVSSLTSTTSALISVESASGFYVIGGTRIKLLDMLVVLALLVGIGIPIAHFGIKMLARKFAKRISGREDS